MQLVVPPAPFVHPHRLSPLRAIWEAARNTLGMWSDYAFEERFTRFSAFGVESVLVNDPEGIRHVLTANAANYRRSPPALRVLRPFAGNGVLMAEGADWRRQRRMLAPLFTPSSVNLLLPHFHAAAARLLADTHGGNLAQAYQNATLDAVLRALFSMPADKAEGSVAELVQRYLRGPGRISMFDALAKTEDDFRFAQRGRRKFRRIWSAAVDAVIARRKNSVESSAQKDLLDLLLAARDADSGQALSGEEVRDQCATMLTAGFETTSRLLFWATYLLTLDEAEQDRVRAEIEAFPPAQVKSLEDLQHWPKLRAVLFEALRLYPTVPNISRESIDRDVICGYQIGPRTQIFISPWVLHRHRAFWPNPTAFDPARFHDQPMPWSANPAFLPFGAGPRFCLGAVFTMAEAQILLGSLLHRFSISLNDTRDVLPIAHISTNPTREPIFELRVAPFSR